MSAVTTLPACGKVADLVAEMAKLPQVDAPTDHTFTPGLYRRAVYMPAGAMIVSKIHKTEHPYVITTGKVSVWTPGEGVVHLQAPHHGITKPGTQRILYIHEDTVWATYHPTPHSDVASVEADIIEPMQVPAETINEGITCLGLRLE